MPSVTLFNPQQAHVEMRRVWEYVKPMLIAGHRLTLSIAQEKRSTPQNRRMWAMLRELSRQVDWHGQRLTDDEWKDVCTAALKRQKVVPGIDGGFVVLGSSTSRMSKAELSEMIDFIHAFGAKHGVVFADEVSHG